MNISNKIELKIGDTIYIDGAEFVIHAFRNIIDSGGRTIEIHGKDPLSAHAHEESLKQHKEQMERSIKILREHEGISEA